MLARCVLILLALVASATNAIAEDKVIPLKRGATVWSILTSQGCTPKQATMLWRLVFKDSGLEPREQRSLQQGQLISIKRGCDGNPFDNGEVGRLTQSLSVIKLELLEEKKETTRLGNENKDLRTRISAIPKRNDWSIRNILLLLVAVGGLSFFLGWRMKAKRSKLSPDTLVFPLEISVEHHTEEHVFRRFVKANECKVGYTCPICGAFLSNPTKVTPHMREVHKNHGKVGWVEIPETT